MYDCWHGYVEVTLTSRRDGTYLGRLGSAYPCDSQADGWEKALAWLRKDRDLSCDAYVLKTFKIDVRYF